MQIKVNYFFANLIKNKNENLEINNLKDPHHEKNLYPQLTFFKFMTTEGSFAV